jgi:hypothetical protein
VTREGRPTTGAPHTTTSSPDENDSQASREPIRWHERYAFRRVGSRGWYAHYPDVIAARREKAGVL